MKTPQFVTEDMLEQKLKQARKTLSDLKVLDGLILYGMGNPPEMYIWRKRLMDAMAALSEVIAEAERELSRARQ